MSRPLPRYTDTHLEDERKLARILLETGEHAPTTTHATAAGDARKLRGIPVIGNISGTSPGTDPYHETQRRMTPRTGQHPTT